MPYLKFHFFQFAVNRHGGRRCAVGILSFYICGIFFFFVVSRGFFLLSCWFWQFVTGCFWELHILKRARTPVWALKALIWACQCESESWTPGNYCWLSWSDPDFESQRLWLGWSLWIFGWLNMTFLGVEALLFTANLWCVFFRIHFLFWVTRVLKFFSDFFILIFLWKQCRFCYILDISFFYFNKVIDFHFSFLPRMLLIVLSGVWMCCTLFLFNSFYWSGYGRLLYAKW